MPWKECQPVDERLRFVARLLDGERMTALCAETRRALSKQCEAKGPAAVRAALPVGEASASALTDTGYFAVVPAPPRRRRTSSRTA